MTTRRLPRVPARGVLPLLLLAGGCSLFFRSPSVSVADVRVGSVGLDGATVELALDVDNPNRYELAFAGLDYTLAIPPEEGTGEAGEWTVLLDGEVSDSARIGPVESTRVVIEVPFRYSALGQAGDAFLRRGRLPYRLRGHVRLEGPLSTIRLPFEEEGTLDPIADLFGK